MKKICIWGLFILVGFFCVVKLTHAACGGWNTCHPIGNGICGRGQMCGECVDGVGGCPEGDDNEEVCQCPSDNDDDGDNGTGAPTCPTGKVSNGLCEAGLRPITVANCCKVVGGGTPTPTPKPGNLTPTPQPGVTGVPCTFTGCSTDHPGYSYAFNTTCTGTCTLGCGGKWPAWPANYACKAEGVCNAGNKCTPDTCTPACKVGETCNAEKKCVPPTSDSTNCQSFVKASVAPSSVRPLDQVTVKCDYGKRLDCLSVTGAGLTNCRYSRYEGTDNIFTCDAGPNAGFYDDAKCVSKKGTTDKCCDSSTKAGDMTIIGTEVHYDQDVILPFGAYTLSARVFSVISKGKGVRVILICNSEICTVGKAKNAEITSMTFRETPDFVDQKLSVLLTGTGDDKHYLVRVSVDKGSEAYFDSVSLKSTKTPQKEFVQNGEFSSATNGSIATKQPASWGEGDNKVGYYYGSVTDTEISSGPNPTQSPTGPTSTPGGAEAISLALKIKLQGVSKKPTTSGAIQVQVKLAGGGLAAATAYKPVQFTVNDAGEWSGKANFDAIPTGGGYRVYIKGPKHIAKKICDSAPTEGKGGEYHCGEGKITLKAGENTLDFSKIILLAGDLPEAGGKQSGIIDAYDTTFVRTNLGSTDTAKTVIGDLNFDGGMDTQDYSMIIQALSIKFDEE